MFLEKAIYQYIRPSTNVDSEPDSRRKQALRMSEMLVDAVITLIALAVAWDCNSRVSGLMKYVCVLYAGMFPTVYLTFYLVYRIILQNPCYEVEAGPLTGPVIDPTEMSASEFV